MKVPIDQPAEELGPKSPSQTQAAEESPDDFSARTGVYIVRGGLWSPRRLGTDGDGCRCCWGAAINEGREVGEVVVTNLSSDYPLIRFATGDLSAILAGPSPCGRTNRRIKGWMGRADQTTKVKGMFVHPQQVAEVVRRHGEIGRARLVVTHADGLDVMTLKCEATGGPALADAIRASIQAVCKLKGEVELVASGTLPNDGKVIEDARKYD